MIQRQLYRTLRPLHPQSPTSTCLDCACRCGGTYSNLFSNPKQRRSYARRAPSTIDRIMSREVRPLTPAEAREQKQRLQYNSDWFDRTCHFLARAGKISVSADSALAFIAAFTSALNASRGQNALQPRLFVDLLSEHGLTWEDAEELSKTLLMDFAGHNLYRGRKLLYSLSRAGHEESTIQVMGHAALEAKQRPGVLGSSEIAWSREHLTKLANEPHTANYRAMVLEGKIALHLKNEEYAIKMFNKAMAAAVAASEGSLHDPTKEMYIKRMRDPLELTAPWHELMTVHLYRSQFKGMDEMALCEAAMQIGCEQDDPVAHKFAADYVKRWEKNEHGEDVHIGTSDWLYHISKAAASGIPRAAHELGVFYAESGWKYIEDEPPDHIKPTPFDSYPKGGAARFWDAPLQLLGIKKRGRTSAEQMFHGAIYPPTAVDRLKIAIKWLELAVEYSYVPSFMMLAQLYNRKTLWAQADAPRNALSLSPKRYTYASKKDFEQGRPISRREPPEKPDPPNPLYNVDTAKLYLREVFNAHEAHVYGVKMQKEYRLRRLRRQVGKYMEDDDLLSTDNLIQEWGLPERLGKWFEFPEVREMNEEVIKGLLEEGKQMCEEEGWELTDEQGGLVFKSGLRGGQGKQ